MYNPSRNNLSKRIVKNRKINSINIIYAGNIGLAQNLEPVLQSFKKLKNQKFNLKICGDGSCKDYLSKNFKSNNISFLGWLGEKDLVSF